MSSVSPRLLLLSAVILSVCAPIASQSEQPAPGGGKVIPVPVGPDIGATHAVKEVPPSLHVPNSIFAIDPTGNSDTSIRVLSEDQMSREDRDLVADAESSIQEHAGFENLDFNGAGWTYHELVCPALPKHMFLRFTRGDGTRQMSMFSAAIPRDGNGRVHIIPIVRKGYSLFSPAPIAAMTVAAFNRIRAEEGESASADWLGTGLCYAALAGASPKMGEAEAGEDKLPVATVVPTLVVTDDGGAVIRFADVSAAPKPMEWNMFFDRRGKLTKATHTPASVTSIGTPIPGTVDESASRP
jgi:hypothetical protein